MMSLIDISHIKLVSDVFKQSHFIDANWFDLGVELNLSYPQLKNIQNTYVNNPSRCLRECLSLWLTSANNRTWESLASALERMNQKPAATLIRNTYDDPASQILQHYSYRISQVSLTDSCIQLLYTEGLITEDTQRKIERCGGSLSDTLRELMIAVSDDHSKLRSLGNILMELEETKPLAQDIIKDCDEMIDRSVAMAVVKPVNHLPTPNASVSASAGEFFFNAAHQSMFDEIRGSFIILIDELVPLISQSKAPIDEMKSFLQRFYPELSAELSDADSIEGIMNIAVKKCRVNNISIIKTIVKRFKINRAKRLISEYEKEVKTVCGSLKDFLSQNQPEHIQFTLGWEREEHSLDDIHNLLEEAFKKKKQSLQPGIIQKWLNEGSVELTVTRVNMHGPPGAGKTCAQDLLLNNPPTTHITDSTPVARPAVKATRVSVDNEAMKWEKVDREGLLERLASDLKKAAASQPVEKKFASQPQEKTSGNSSPVSTNEQQTAEQHNESNSEKNDFATKTDESTVASASNESFSIGEGVIQEIVDTIQSSEVQLNLSGHWLYIIDSGGQPAYQELLPLFVRTASLNIITLDLSQPLDEKLDFQYRIGGKTFSCGLNFKYSNREFFLSAVSSGAILKPINVPHVLETPSHPMNFVLGTHYDLITEDKLKEMNKELMSSLKPDIENSVVPNVRGESIIFPVNTLVPEDKGRMKAGQDLCQSIANCGGTSLKINVPIRWFAFELWLQKVAEDKSRSFLIIDEVISAGAKLKMSEDDTKDALQYLHNVTIILYYPDILPKLVFVDPKPILEVLSRLLALTYVERKALHLIANPVPREEDINELHDFGFFKEELLTNHFKPLFSPPYFEASHLLKLLIHLRIIASGEDGDYFSPCALEAYTKPPDPETDTQALLIVWLKKIKKKTLRLPVPQGMFPLLITHLLSYKKDEVEFPDASKPQYYRHRDALSLWIKIERKRYTLHIINHYTHIEVYFDGSVQKAKPICPYIRELVMKAVSDSADAINVEHNHVTAFSCPKRSTCYCVVDVEEEDFETNCTSCADSADISGDRYWCWFGIVDCDSKIIMSGSGYSQPLDVCDLDDILTDLKDGHYYSSDWKELGLKLGLYDNTLSAISASSSEIEECLRECIVKWLQRADSVDDKGGATRTTLVNALEQCDSGKPTADHISE
uniref:Death domain-containing protein n=1 Tax=Amphimedon queenslandica TaxID=400682 RepID=A0A1X7SZP3_AMPQE